MSEEIRSDMDDYIVRTAEEADRLALSKLSYYEAYVHRHLDWQAPLDWIGWRSFLLMQQRDKIVAALACPMDLPATAWIRLFVVGDDVHLKRAWELLWASTRAVFSVQRGCTIAAIPLYPWMVELLDNSGFDYSNDVIILKWESGMRMPETRQDIVIRQMRNDDIRAVHQLDAVAFQPLWQNSEVSLELALGQAVIATVAEDTDGVVGYQISTSSHMGGHIARLAVHPKKQGQDLGYALVYDVLRQFERNMIFRVTVNTQRDNLISQHLYRKAGFQKTGEAYPVFQIQP